MLYLKTLYKKIKIYYLFLLAYDRYIKLWDTETGDCISRFTSRKIPFCAKFHPDNDKQHLFVAGTSDKKIICVSTFLPIFILAIPYLKF